MSAADHTDLLFMPRKQMMKSRRFIVFTIWVILIISFFVSIAYWWTLSGFEDAVKDPNVGHFTLFLLLMTVGTGAATELVKTVSLGYARNKKLWLYATIVSVITVMGTYAILDQDRKNRLQAGSDAHKTDLKRQESNDDVLQRTGYANGIGLQGIEKMRADNLYKLQNAEKYPRVKYDKEESRIAEVEKDYYSYQNAKLNQVDVDSNVSKGGDDVVTNPLLHNVAKLIAYGQTNAVVMAFYLAVTVLLEWAAFTLGGRIEAIDVYIQNVESHIADLTNMRVFGMSMKQVNVDIAKGAIHAQRQRIQFDKEMRRAVLEQTDADGNSMSLQETNKYVNELQGQSAVASQHSGMTVPDSPNVSNQQQSVVASGSSLDGLSYADLVAKHSAAVSNNGSSGHCITCDAEFQRSNRSLYCSPDHSREYQKILKRVKRAEGIS